MRISTAGWEARLGAQARRARLLENITQVDLARQANISPVTLHKLETGHGGTIGTLIRVVSALGRADWLESLEPQPPVSPLALLRAAEGSRESQRVSRKR